jgi:hypothetical protein
MRIRETRFHFAGFGGREEVRVRDLAEGEELPVGAAAVPSDTPRHDWQPAAWPAPEKEG